MMFYVMYHITLCYVTFSEVNLLSAFIYKLFHEAFMKIEEKSSLNSLLINADKLTFEIFEHKALH